MNFLNYYLLKYYIDPRLETVARDIIEEQSRGVRQLEEVRNYLCQCINLININFV